MGIFDAASLPSGPTSQGITSSSIASWAQPYINQYLTPEGDREITSKGIHLPKDFSKDIPSKAKHWLEKYNITDDEIDRFNFGWSESYQRLILPVYNDDKLTK